jgi:hypothetical protein
MQLEAKEVKINKQGVGSGKGRPARGTGLKAGYAAGSSKAQPVGGQNG